MTSSCTSIATLALSDYIQDIKSVHFDPKSKELFIIGTYDQIALVTLTGQLITIQELPENSNIIAQQRMPVGWQFISQRNSGLTNCTITKDNISEVPLKGLCEKPRTVVWSPCGQYVAVGSEGTTLSAWDIHTGKQIMQKNMYWDKADDADFINPPTLSVIGWSENSEKIITNAEEIISNSILIWNFKTQEVVTIIQ